MHGKRRGNTIPYDFDFPAAMGVEELEDIEVASLSGKWIKSDVAAVARKAQFYLDNKDSEIAYKLLNQKGYFLIQTNSRGVL